MKWREVVVCCRSCGVKVGLYIQPVTLPARSNVRTRKRTVPDEATFTFAIDDGADNSVQVALPLRLRASSYRSMPAPPPSLADHARRSGRALPASAAPK